MPGASGPHGGEQELREPRGTEKINLKLIACFVHTDLFYRAVETKTGVVDQHIDTASLIQNGIHAGYDVLIAGNIHP